MSKSKLHVYDGESASLLVSLQTDHEENGINSTTCNFEVFDAYCATIGASGTVYIHPLTVYIDRKFMSGNRIPITKKKLPLKKQTMRSKHKKMPKKVLAKKPRAKMQNQMNPAKMVFGSSLKTASW